MKKNLSISDKKYILIPIFLAFILAIPISIFWVKNHQNNAHQSDSATNADYCALQSPITFGCYKKELTNITSTQGPEKATALLKQDYQMVDYVKSQCHQLMHIIGRAAYTRYSDIGVAFTHGDQFCWAGYYHGLMEAMADQKGTTAFLASLDNICKPIEAKGQYSFNHYNCVHGLGHGVMEALNGNLFDSLSACNRLTESYNRTSCYGGVFMQNIMIVQSPDDTVDHKSAYLKADDPMYPCTAVDDMYKQQCYLMQTSYALQVENYDFAKVFGLCQATPILYKDTCYQSVGRDASGQSVSDVLKTKTTCMLGQDFVAQSNCIIGASKDFVSYFHSDSRAKELCASLTSSLQDLCFSTVKSYYASF